MEEFWNAIKERFEKLRETWNGLNLNQKVVIAGALLLVIAAVGVSSATVMQTQYEPLYTDLKTSDAASMTAKLTELGIPYELADNGTTINVPTEQKYEARLQLASSGLPAGVAGLELFNTTNFGETETDKQVKYQMALEGELTRTIESMDKVDSAEVNLALPEESLFTESQQQPTASILIRPKAGGQLSDKEVQSITHLVANSIEGLNVENVTIADTSGNLLSTGLPSDFITSMVDLTEHQLAMKRQFEKQLQQSIQSMLEQIYGAGKAIVRVNAELNFDEKTTKTEKYGPGSYVESEKITEKTSTNSAGATGGTPGTDTNIPNYQEGANSDTGTSSSEESEKIRNYLVDKEVTDQKYAPGDPKRLTVTVIVDKSLDEQQKDEIKQAVETAVGIDRDNPDSTLKRTVSVTSMKFTASPKTLAETTDISGMVSQYWWLVLILIFLLAGFAVWMALRGGNYTKQPR
ncbi:MAG: flagellar basal-body MS-ring/collar protein FliF, partial [Ignavibacteriales bacterium]